MSNHEKSKKHKENATFLKLVMEEDEARESGRDRKREDKELVDLSELGNLSESDSSSSLNEVDLLVDNPIPKKESTELPSTTASVDGEGNGPIDDSTEEENRDDDVVDFGVFGRRKTDACGPIGDELANEQVNSDFIDVFISVLQCRKLSKN